jgi:rhodanese-related sulfurtransferase
MQRRSPGTALVILVLVVSAAIAACSTATPSSSPGAPAASTGAGSTTSLPVEVSTSDALALRGSGAFMLDVREPDEWAAGHIPDATLIPLGDLPSRIAEVPTGRQVVVVCRSGNRSASGRDILLNAGYASVTSMAGGMNDWTAKGYPTTTGS